MDGWVPILGMKYSNIKFLVRANLVDPKSMSNFPGAKSCDLLKFYSIEMKGSTTNAKIIQNPNPEIWTHCNSGHGRLHSASRFWRIPVQHLRYSRWIHCQSSGCLRITRLTIGKKPWWSPGPSTRIIRKLHKSSVACRICVCCLRLFKKKKIHSWVFELRTDLQIPIL